jgi:hypothetical protein
MIGLIRLCGLDCCGGLPITLKYWGGRNVVATALCGLFFQVTEKVMKNRTMISAVSAALVLGLSFAFAEGVSLEGVKCIIAPRAAKEANSAEWKEGKVFFCCGNCQGKFEKMSKEEKEKMAAKSNSQLVATKQYEQKACPISGGKLNENATTEVAGVKVAFCCNNCKGKVDGLEGDEQLDSVFGEKAFEKAKFAKVESK